MQLGSKIASDVAHYLRLISSNLQICARCKTEIVSGKEEALRTALRVEISSLGAGPRGTPPRLVASEFATMLASWQLAPFPHPAVTRGFVLFNALCTRFPATNPDDRTFAGLLERDLGNDVFAIFSICEGALVIDNFVSRTRGKGLAPAALHVICGMADETGTVILGVAEPNSYGDTFAAGLPFEVLLAWYAREGFSVFGTVGVRREPCARTSEG